MGNLEKLLTWVFAIVFMGYLFIANCKCGEDVTCPLNSTFNINSSGVNAGALEVDILTVDDVIPAPELDEGDTAVAIETSGDTTDIDEDGE